MVIHACVRISVLNMWIFTIWNNRIARDYWFTISQKGVPWKSWLDPRFPRNSKPKWTLKWLPLDRGYFKFYFHKGESILIISYHTYLLARNFVILFQVMFALPCILFLFELSRNSLLLINDPSKKGDVKILARSSIFPPPQVKMMLKLTVSR